MTGTRSQIVSVAAKLTTSAQAITAISPLIDNHLAFGPPDHVVVSSTKSLTVWRQQWVCFFVLVKMMMANSLIPLYFCEIGFVSQKRSITQVGMPQALAKQNWLRFFVSRTTFPT